MHRSKKNLILIEKPTPIQEIKELIYQGKILLLTNCKSSRALARFAVQFLKENLNTNDPKNFEHTISNEEFHFRTSKLKTIFSKSSKTKTLVRIILEELNFKITTSYFDLVRLRCITSYAHRVKAAKPAFAVHRDTWYANPETQINFWIPLFDVSKKDTFSFYPDFFLKPVKNNSNEFDYNSWKKIGGYQSSKENKNRIFPELKEKINFKNKLKISCKSGDLLLFSASHLHGTSPNLTSSTRFSLDFRVIDTDDLNKPYPPNIDNKSKGSILKDMLPLRK